METTIIQNETTDTRLNKFKSFKEKILRSQLMACIAGSFVLFASFGVRQTFGVFLVPVTSSTGWDRSTFSIAAAVFQLLWGFSQPFVVYFAERKWGFGKTIFVSCTIYAAGLYILHASGSSPGVFIFAYGIVVGLAAGGNSFPVILAAIGRRFPQQSKQQGVAFGLVSSFGSLGQVVFLPIIRTAIVQIDWQMSFVILGIIMTAVIPLSFFLQTVPAMPALPASEAGKKSLLDGGDIVIKPTTMMELPNDKEEKREIKIATPRVDIVDEESLKKIPTKDLNGDKDDTFSAPDIKTALKEAFSSPTFIMITLGFTVCGFHVSFLATHFPAYVQDQGISSSLAAWTISIFGVGSFFGSMATGYVTNYLSPRLCLSVIYLVRVVLFVIYIFIPVSVATTVVFSSLFGLFWLTTVPLTTKFVGDVFGHKYLGTLTSITFVGHQLGAFIGAYIGGIVYDATHDYIRMWYVCIAMAAFAVVMNFFAGEEPINMRRRGIQ